MFSAEKLRFLKRVYKHAVIRKVWRYNSPGFQIWRLSCPEAWWRETLVTATERKDKKDGFENENDRDSGKEGGGDLEDIRERSG